MERGKGKASEAAEKFLTAWRKGTKGAQTRELKKETDWVEGMKLGSKRPK